MSTPDPRSTPDPLEFSLEAFAEVARRLDEETNKINVQISRCEEVLVQWSPGMSLIWAMPLRVDQEKNSEEAKGSDFGFFKLEDEWRLWVRRGKLKKVNQSGWILDTPDRIIPLLDGTREERAAACGQLPKFVEHLKARVQEQLNSLRAAKDRVW